jgi:hypothetical protein
MKTLQRILLLGLNLGALIAQEASTPIDVQIKQADEQIKALEKLTSEWVDRYNKLIDLKSAGHVAANLGPTPGVNAAMATTLPDASVEQKMRELQDRIQKLEGGKGGQASLEAIRAEAEKKAAENAPLLPVDSQARAQYEQALTLLNKNETPKALEAFKLVAESYPGDYYAYLAQIHVGECHLKMADYGSALAALQKAEPAKISPEKENEVKLDIIEVKLALQRTHEACGDCAQVKSEHLSEDQKKRLHELQRRAGCTTHTKPAEPSAATHPTKPAEPTAATHALTKAAA